MRWLFERFGISWTWKFRWTGYKRKKVMSIFAKIKALWALNKEINKMSISELKTSEGRLQLIMQILNIYAAVQGFIPPALAAKISAIALAAYTIGRALVKAAEAIAKLTPTPKDDKIVEEAAKVLDAVAPKVEEQK